MIQSEDEILYVFAQHFKNVRKKYGYTLESLAGKAEMDLSHIAKIETCKRNPKSSTLVRLSKAIGIPLSELIDFHI